MYVGSVTRSRGFRRKMIDNPHMGSDHRNLGLIGTCDGVPFFDDQRRGGWCFVLRCGNLPDTLSTHMANCHLHMLSGNEFWEIDKKANILRRKIHAPKSLHAHMTIQVNDFRRAYLKGISVRFVPYASIMPA